jgi:hypothetical protein
LYAFALTNKWHGAIGGNLTTGVTAIFMGKQAKKIYSNKILIGGVYGVEIEYEVPNSACSNFELSLQNKNIIRLFIHAKVSNFITF